MSDYGKQCDAITKNGRRCRCKSLWFIPCEAVYDARMTSLRTETFKPVRLCEAHATQEWKLRSSSKRLQLHNGGWFGAFNRHKFGNLVIDSPTVDWDKPRLTVPKFWAQKEVPNE